MNRHVMLACQPEVVSIPITSILPLKKLPATISSSRKYQCIAASIAEIGIIEPLMVYSQDKANSSYMLLDGHLRMHVAKELGRTAVDCLIANDDEAFTYNHKVNRLAPIQEHFMIRRAISNGVSEERIAKTLHVDVASICRKRDLLDGICPEAVELLKDRAAAAGAIREMRRVRPMRQIEMAELMIASNNFSAVYAKCMLAGTSREQLIESEQVKEVAGLAPADIARIEREMESLQSDFLRIEETHGKNMLNLVIVVGYLKKMLDNARVGRFLSGNYPEIFTEFKRLLETRSLPEARTDS